MDSQYREAGFTLVEAVVSATVLSIGVLGMAAMQGMALSKNVDAHDLSIVTNLASDMVERIQNSRRIAWAYNTITTAGGGNCLTGAIPAAQPAPPFPAAPLSVAAARKVQGDCVQWRQLVQDSNLLNVLGTVTVTPVVPLTADSGAMLVTVRVQWNERAQGQRLRQVVFQTQVVPE
ncbi:MAG: type IV pilus modification protein PilV [Nitrospira sp.]|nr:type IV pilus modification protein PilV [Nitrospira sp.]MCP9464898.1 type IV pilus modification protein PilV [Nitrospira sp.]